MDSLKTAQPATCPFASLVMRPSRGLERLPCRRIDPPDSMEKRSMPGSAPKQSIRARGSGTSASLPSSSLEQCRQSRSILQQSTIRRRFQRRSMDSTKRTQRRRTNVEPRVAWRCLLHSRAPSCSTADGPCLNKGFNALIHSCLRGGRRETVGYKTALLPWPSWVLPTASGGAVYDYY
jgi:hypothetical protein